MPASRHRSRSPFRACAVTPITRRWILFHESHWLLLSRPFQVFERPSERGLMSLSQSPPGLVFADHSDKVSAFLKQAELGVPVAEVIWKVGITLTSQGFLVL